MILLGELTATYHNAADYESAMLLFQIHNDSYY